MQCFFLPDLGKRPREEEEGIHRRSELTRIWQVIEWEQVLGRWLRIGDRMTGKLMVSFTQWAGDGSGSRSVRDDDAVLHADTAISASVCWLGPWRQWTARLSRAHWSEQAPQGLWITGFHLLVWGQLGYSKQSFPMFIFRSVFWYFLSTPRPLAPASHSLCQSLPLHSLPFFSCLRAGRPHFNQR